MSGVLLGSHRVVVYGNISQSSDHKKKLLIRYQIKTTYYRVSEGNRSNNFHSLVFYRDTTLQCLYQQSICLETVTKVQRISNEKGHNIRLLSKGVCDDETFSFISKVHLEHICVTETQRCLQTNMTGEKYHHHSMNLHKVLKLYMIRKVK